MSLPEEEVSGVKWPNLSPFALMHYIAFANKKDIQRSIFSSDSKKIIRPTNVFSQFQFVEIQN